MTRQEWERVARKQLGVEPDAMIPAALERPRGLREFRYEGRYILADGRPHRFVAYSSNRSDAAAAIERQAREELGDAFAGARCEGTERV